VLTLSGVSGKGVKDALAALVGQMESGLVEAESAER
jgi:hypothetical protein